MTKIFVVSLPRTGTSSISTLFNNVDIKCKHVPSNYYNHLKDEYDAFADTPCFDPNFIAEVCYNEPNTHKFIYICRPVYDWMNSIEKSNLHIYYKDMVDNCVLNGESFMDKKTWGNVFGYDGIYLKTKFRNKFFEHRKNIDNLLRNEKIFYYNIGTDVQGLLTFLNVNVSLYPNIKFPHENKATLF